MTRMPDRPVRSTGLRRRERSAGFVLGAWVWLVLVGLLAQPAAAAEFDPDDPCSLIPPGYVIDRDVEDAPSDPYCAFELELDGDHSVSALVVKAATPDAARAEIEAEASTDSRWRATSRWGDLAYEAGADFLGAPAYLVTFARTEWAVTVFACCPSVQQAQDAASYIDASLQMVPPPGPSSPDPLVSAAPGEFSLGLGCGEDGVVLACTVSVYNAPEDSDTWFQWAIDGTVLQGETGQNLKVDQAAIGLSSGTHLIEVTATDRNSGTHASTSMAFETTARVFAVTTPSCTQPTRAFGSDYEFTCTTTVVDVPAGAQVEYDWTVAGKNLFVHDASIRVLTHEDAAGVTVSARDTVSGRTTATKSTTVIANPVGFFTSLLTGGQTSDPAHVFEKLGDFLAGTAAGGTGIAVLTGIHRLLTRAKGS